MAQTTEGASQVVDSVKFSFMTDEDVRKHSFLKVTNPVLLDNLGEGLPGGLYDPLLGPLEDRSSCKSCGQFKLGCPGHCGHIELVYPIYHPLLFNFLYNLLQNVCFFCHQFKAKKEDVDRCVSQLRLIIKGDVVAAKQLDSKSESTSTESEDSDADCESGAPIDSSKEYEDSDMKKQRWTSLQFAEVTAVISSFAKLKLKKCATCCLKSPKLEKPMFGWIRMDMKGQDYASNAIRVVKMKKSASSVEVENPDDCDDSGIDALSEVEESAKEKRKKYAKAAEESVYKAKRDLLPTEVREILKDLWDNEYEFCSFIGGLRQSGSKKVDYSMFFLESVLVPPTKFRAPTKGGDSVMEHPQTMGLTKVLQSNITLGNACTNKIDQSKIISRWMNLQESVNVLYDSKTATVQSQRESSGICQLLEKKEGLFRQKMMGKRVNHACRSVISPDPYIAVNDIGIPPCFALKLTYPERVTPWNVEKLREAIINGPDIHPGATHYADKESTIILPPTKKGRTAIARKLMSSRGGTTDVGKTCDVNFEGKVVYRHMQDGDVVLVNRQPTLHKPSIMAHMVRVLNGEKTLRLHYANCSTYNADFDGDEMNVHFPQDEISRAEAYNIVNANNQYARPSNGDPLRALIQDHIVSSVLLTKRDTFLDKEEFNQLLFSSGVTGMVLGSFSGKSGKKVMQSASGTELLAVTPAILKPVPLWTGKQVITAVLNQITKGHPPFTVEKATKLPVDFFKCRSRQDKSKKLLTKKQGIDESWKQNLNEDKLHIRKNEFVCGVIDKAQFADYGLVHTVHELYGSSAAGTLLSVFSRLFTVFLQSQGFTCGVDDLIILKDMDEQRTKQLQECEQVGEKVLRKTLGIDADAQIDPQERRFRFERFIYENGESALASFDRGIVNELNQCSGKGVMNDLLSDGLLKTTGKNCISLMTISGAKGSKVNFQQISSHLGQQDLEGKRVPRMVSGKTLPCFHPWDWSPRAGGFISDRFLSGLRPQEYYFHCMAGREGLVDTAVKTSRSGYLQRCLMKNLESLKVNYDCTVRDADGSIIQFQYGEDGVDVHQSSFIGKFKQLAANQDMVLQRCSEDMLSGTSSYITDLPITLKKGAEKFVEEMPMNERIASNLVRQEELLKLVKSKFFASLAQPGEPVGVLAAQSVGEPSTQMTLNTFHLAGRGEMNVTLGIPRLQEILMTAAANIKTPIMTCPLRKGKTEVDANAITDKLRKITVADIIKSMDVSMIPYAVHNGKVCSIHKLKIELYKPEHYPKHTDITDEDWQETMNAVFLRKLEDTIEIHMKMLCRMRGIKNFKQDKQPRNGNETDNDDSVSGKQAEDDDDDEGEGTEVDDLGTDAQKRKKQGTDEMDYEENSGDEKNEPSSISGVEDPEMDNEEVTKEESPEPQEEADVSKEETLEQQEEVEAGKNVGKRSEKQRRQYVPAKYDRNISAECTGNIFKVKFKFTTEEPHMLLAQIAQKTAQKVYIQNSGKIERCTVANCGDPQVIYYGDNPKERNEVSNDEKKAQPALHASGIDFPSLWEFQDKLDVRYLYSNSIHDMLNTFGVEAARETIIREINHVFKSYGISVSIRHLNLIADYMTFSGEYRPMSRMGGIAESTSPFCRMTFETATKFIVQAATYGEVDTLETPSARICLGLPALSGTGCFDLLQRVEL